MKKKTSYRLLIILFSVIGIIILGIISFVLDYGAKHSDDTQFGKINRIMDHDIDPQIIVFGASSGEVSIDPSIIRDTTGLTCFNACITGTRFLQYEGLIREVGEYSKVNQMVVLSESYFSFEKISAVTSIERFMPHMDNRNVYQSLFMVQPDLAWKCKHIPFYKYVAATHVYYKNAVIGWKNVLHHKQNEDLGFSPVHQSWQADADDDIKSMGFFKISMDPVILNEYINLIRSIEKSNRKAVILLTPVYGEMLSRVTDIRPLRVKLDSVARVTNAVFLDFTSNPICRDKSMFYNSLHLNNVGSAVFSKMLADSLRKIVVKSS
jgi:hypothetical protein